MLKFKEFNKRKDFVHYNSSTGYMGYYIGFLGYSIAKEQLNEKGETILKNSVKMALQMIDLANKRS